MTMYSHKGVPRAPEHALAAGIPTPDQHKLNCLAKVIDNNRLIQRITTLICVELAECEGCFRCRYQIGAAAKVQEAKEKKKWLQFSLIRLSFCNWHLSSFSIHINCLISSSSYLISFFTSIPIFLVSALQSLVREEFLVLSDVFIISPCIVSSLALFMYTVCSNF